MVLSFWAGGGGRSAAEAVDIMMDRKQKEGLGIKCSKDPCPVISILQVDPNPPPPPKFPQSPQIASQAGNKVFTIQVCREHFIFKP